jgi:hypothetical protein
VLLLDLLRHLTEHRVRFSVIGGVALVARGVNRGTEDLDIAYARDRENLQSLAKALEPLHPSLRGAPKDLPFVIDAPTLRMGLNFTLDTDLGPLDLLGDVPGLGTFSEVDRYSDELEVEGVRVLVLTIEGLERSKRAAGRPKDLLDLGFIERLKQLEQ